MQSNPLTKASADAMRQTGSSMPTVSGGPSWILFLSIGFSLTVAIALLLASLQTPQPLRLTEKLTLPPVLQKHSQTAVGYLSAILLGLIVAVLRH